MTRFRWVAAVLAVSACHRTGGGAADSGGPQPVVTAPPNPATAFSEPIAAARVTGAVVVAGLVAQRGVVAVSAIGDDHAVRWTVDAIDGISGGPNVELHVFPTPTGSAVVYRGRRGERPVTLAVLVDASGKVSRPPFEAGPAACATDDALAWIDRPSGHAARVLGLPWGRGEPIELFTVPAERDPALVCGNKTVFGLGDGEQDTTVATWPLASPQSRLAMRDRDFSDEEREHDTFVAGDTLGLVRVGQSGNVSLRELGSEVSPWRRLAAKLTEADDVVAVDGDTDATTLVFTRDDGGACDGPGAPSVRALRVSKATTPPEESLELAPAQCDRELGPFWTGGLADAFAVAWVERAAMRASSDPPIVGLAYRTLTRSGLGELRRVPRRSDEMVDAGCDREHCYAAALVRADHARDVEPAVEIVVYP